MRASCNVISKFFFQKKSQSRESWTKREAKSCDSSHGRENVYRNDDFDASPRAPRGLPSGAPDAHQKPGGSAFRVVIASQGFRYFRARARASSAGGGLLLPSTVQRIPCLIDILSFGTRYSREIKREPADRITPGSCPLWSQASLADTQAKFIAIQQFVHASEQAVWGPV